MEIKYIIKLNRELKVATLDVGDIYIPKTFNQFMDNLLLNDLTTYEGRISATKQKYHLIKQTPIYINDNCVLISTASARNLDNIYLNIKTILLLEEKGTSTIITFLDQTTISIPFKRRHITSLIQRAQVIKR